MIRDISDMAFFQLIERQGIITLIDFTAEWCPHCVVLKPLLEEIAGDYSDRIEVYYLDTDLYPDLADSYDIMTIPALYAFCNGECLGYAINPQSKEEIVDLFHLP